MTSKCKKEEVAFKAFLFEHFKLGGDCPNPRLILSFLNNVLEESVAYYSRNPDDACAKIQPNELGEYEVFLKEHVFRGFQKTQVTARETVGQLNKKWSRNVTHLFSKLQTPKQCENIHIEKIKEYSDWTSDDDEFKRFIAFFTHVGLLVPGNDSISFENRVFSLPLIMRICPNH